MKGPLLLASNHPNSFLDAIILDILFEQPVWSLARGDIFKNTFYTKILTRLKMLPVYRTSEGVENLETNYRTFDSCKQLFRNKGVVQVFSEGTCINEWHLRPLKKGTARLAISSWEDGIDLKVLPVGINYSSFNRFGKNIFLNFGSLITRDEILAKDTDGKRNQYFNDKLRQELELLVFEISPGDKDRMKKLLVVRQQLIWRILLAAPAITGLVLNAPVYFAVRYFTLQKINDADHYDSVLIACLVFIYPFYLVLATGLLCWLTGSWLGLLALIIIPITARAFVQLKGQLDK